MATTKPYGTWASPVSADMVVEGAVSITDVQPGDDDLWWSELRPQDGGRIVVVRRQPGGGLVDVVPEGFSARTRVHEYGGGAWWLHDDTLIFANWADQRLYRIEPDTEPGAFRAPRPITPEPTDTSSARYADGVLTADGRWIICVRELHGDPSASEARNEIVAIEAEQGGEPTVLVTGPDFVAAPRVSPDGRSLCWLQWNHPDMPWDGCELAMASLDSESDTCAAGPPRVLAGSRNEAITQPEWHADGSLWFVSDRTDWWNLYRITADSLLAAEPTAAPIAPFEGEVGVPAWVFGQSRYAFLPGERVAVAYASEGIDHLAIISPNAVRPGPEGADWSAATMLDLETDFVTLASVHTYGHGLVFIGATAASESVVAVADLPAHGDATIAVLRAARDSGLGSEWISLPRSISVVTPDGGTTYALFYSPTHPTAAGPSTDAPPLVVLSHGGPTSAARPHFNLAVQYWTSRGFAVVDVNYRGSTGYGRAYRQALAGQWGVVDVDDCVAVARHLVSQGESDGDRLAIRGGSAGGYTTLCALAFRDDFRAGTSLYGVADLEALARDTHKFESRYLDSLIGPYPAERDRYVERSPIHHIEGFNCPLLVLQGLEDEIVPPAQSEMIVDAVRAKGLPVAYLAFAGEQHGFRQAATIKRALEAELYFYAQVFDFELAEPIEPVPIENL